MSEETDKAVKLIEWTLGIPKEEQLKAFCEGGPALWKLVTAYKNPSDRRDVIPNSITVSKADLLDYVRKHPEICDKYLYKEGDPRYHEWSILEYDGKKYTVYTMDHDDPWDIKKFDDFAEATVNFLYRNVGLPPGFFLCKDI